MNWRADVKCHLHANLLSIGLRRISLGYNTNSHSKMSKNRGGVHIAFWVIRIGKLDDKLCMLPYKTPANLEWSRRAA